jgi:hypothetical protein
LNKLRLYPESLATGLDIFLERCKIREGAQKCHSHVFHNHCSMNSPERDESMIQYLNESTRTRTGGDNTSSIITKRKSEQKSHFREMRIRSALSAILSIGVV